MIILLGFPKSGTSSFQELFTQLGYDSYHWKKGSEYIGMMIKKNKNNNKPLLNDFKENDVITQMDVCIDKENSYWPQIVDYIKLYNENKNSIYILNKRNPEKLLDSFKRWRKYDERLYLYSPELIEDKSDNGFINFVNNHYKKIEDFFENKPESKFISYNIEIDNLEKLKQYIDVKDYKELPRKNVNPMDSNNFFLSNLGNMPVRKNK